MRALLSSLVLAIVACGPRAPAPHPTPRTGSGSAVAPKPNVNGPSEHECDELFAHAFAIIVAAKQTPPADAEATARDVRPAFVADCRAGTRAYQQCGLAATSQAELDACRR